MLPGALRPSAGYEISVAGHGHSCGAGGPGEGIPECTADRTAKRCSGKTFPVGRIACTGPESRREASIRWWVTSKKSESPRPAHLLSWFSPARVSASYIKLTEASLLLGSWSRAQNKQTIQTPRIQSLHRDSAGVGNFHLLALLKMPISCRRDSQTGSGRKQH